MFNSLESDILLNVLEVVKTANTRQLSDICPLIRKENVEINTLKLFLSLIWTSL